MSLIDKCGFKELELTPEIKEIIWKGIRCMLSPHKRVVEQKQLENGWSRTWEDEEGNRYGEIFGVNMIISNIPKEFLEEEE